MKDVPPLRLQKHPLPHWTSSLKKKSLKNKIHSKKFKILNLEHFYENSQFGNTMVFLSAPYFIFQNFEVNLKTNKVHVYYEPLPLSHFVRFNETPTPPLSADVLYGRSLNESASYEIRTNILQLPP